MADSVSRHSNETETLYSRVDLFLEAERNNPELLRDTLWRMIDINREITRTQKRTGLAMAGAAIAFELLNRGLVGEASFGGIKVSQVEFLTSLAPLAVSYCFLRFIVLSRDLGVYRAIVVRITSRAFPGLYTSDFDRMLPYAYLGGSTVTWLPVGYSFHLKRIWIVAALLEAAVFILTPAIFLIYAYWQLFSSGPTDILVWLSLIGAVLFLSFSLTFGIAISRMSRGVRLKEFDEVLSIFGRKRRI
jgi:hypothetical protein